MFILTLFIFVSALTYEGRTKQYTRCQITNILYRNGFDRSLLPTCKFTVTVKAKL